MLTHHKAVKGGEGVTVQNISPTVVERKVAVDRLNAMLNTPPEGVLPSPLDKLRLENSDIGLDDAVNNNGGQFFVCNAAILAGK